MGGPAPTGSSSQESRLLACQVVTMGVTPHGRDACGVLASRSGCWPSVPPSAYFLRIISGVPGCAWATELKSCVGGTSGCLLAGRRQKWVRLPCRVTGDGLLVAATGIRVARGLLRKQSWPVLVVPYAWCTRIRH